MILLGVIPIVALAIITDAVMTLLIRMLSPKGIGGTA
jgi:ABC-type proline/glycine betaine transport system permease subunit